MMQHKIHNIKNLKKNPSQNYVKCKMVIAKQSMKLYCLKYVN